MGATIYAFKKDKAKTYRQNEGIVFSLNGQTHGFLTSHFFTRKNLALNYLSDSIFVIVDCSKFSGRAREDLFMNSRDRLSHGEFRTNIEKALEEVLKHNQLLRDLRAKRRNEEIESKISNSKPLEDLLNTVIRKSPSLSSLFLKGQVDVPFKPQEGGTGRVFHGKKHPTFFKLMKTDYGKEYTKNCHINKRARLFFETDVVNDYFNRRIDPGNFSLYKNDSSLVEDYTLNLNNGTAILNLELPANAQIGDCYNYTAEVSASHLISSFVNRFTIKVVEPANSAGSSGGSRRKPPGKSGDDNIRSRGIALPEITKVYESETSGPKTWTDMRPTPFDRFSALRIKLASSKESDSDSDADIYDFFINMDNH